VKTRFNDKRWLWRSIERVATAGGWPALAAARLGFPTDIVLEHHDIEVPAFPGAQGALRIAFASDFHAGPSTPPVVIERAVQRLGELEADVLLLGGDFVCQRSEYARDLARQVAEIPAPLGKYAVLGNHDHWSGAGDVTRHLEDQGIHVLTNRNVRLPEPFDRISVCGIDDHTAGDPDAEMAFAGSAATRILLMHAPSNLLDVGDRGFVVALCGHTHGGQIARRDGRPLKVAQGALSRRYNWGRFDVGHGRTLIVSRGIGCSTFPVRFNAPPAVIRVHLRGRHP